MTITAKIYDRTFKVLLENNYGDEAKVYAAQLLNSGYSYSSSHLTRASIAAFAVSTPIVLTGKSITQDGKVLSLTCDAIDFSSTGAKEAAYCVIHRMPTGSPQNTDELVLVYTFQGGTNQSTTQDLRISEVNTVVTSEVPITSGSTGLFSNTTFFADTGSNGLRTPVDLNFESTIPNPPPVTNPDPGGPGGGTPTGGDIGDVDGAGISTLGDAPTIARKTHSQDIYVSNSATMTITYVASEPCTMLPKGGFEDMVVSYSNDGLEMTLSWTCPANEPGDSYYIGCEVWKYGSDISEATNVLWDRLHVGKISSDIRFIGANTSQLILQNAIDQSDIVAGQTLIINEGVYTNSRDHLNVGYYDNNRGLSGVGLLPNGVQDGVYTVNVIGDDGVTVTGTEDIVKISKFTTVMAATPCSAIIDRLNRDFGSSLQGNYRDGGTDGFRTVHGIKIKGVALRNCLRGYSMARTDSCAFEWVSVMHDVLPSEYTAATGNPATYQDGASYAIQSTRNCYIDVFNGIHNNRFGAQMGSKEPWGENASKHTMFRRGFMTTGCVQARVDEIIQTYTGYGARHTRWLNCISIDGALFMAGIERDLPLSKSGKPADSEHTSFIHTNDGSDDNLADRCLSLNTSMAGYANDSRNDLIKSSLKNSVFWNKRKLNADGQEWFSSRSMVRGEYVDMLNLSIGKNERVNTGFASSALVVESAGMDHDNILVAYPRWNYSYTDQVLIGQPALGGNYAFAPETQLPPATYLSSLDQYTTITGNNLKTSGFHYISRIERNSTLAGQNTGCQSLFQTIGRTGKLYLDNDLTVYNINHLSRGPWREFRRERKTYNCTTNGITFTGDTGVAKDGIHPTDYINREGTSPDHPLNTPYIDDIYGKALGGGAVTLWWRPVCSAYRSTISGYNIFVDGVNIGPQLKSATSIPLTNINPGTRVFEIQVIDAVYGNSGKSRALTITVA